MGASLRSPRCERPRFSCRRRDGLETQGRGLGQSLSLSWQVPGPPGWSQESVQRPGSPWFPPVDPAAIAPAPQLGPAQPPSLPSLTRLPGLPEGRVPTTAHLRAPQLGGPQAGSHGWELPLGGWL